MQKKKLLMRGLVMAITVTQLSSVNVFAGDTVWTQETKGYAADEAAAVGYTFDAATGKLTIAEAFNWDDMNLFIEDDGTIDPEDVISLEIDMSGTKNSKYWSAAGVKNIVSECVNVQEVVFTGTVKSGLEVDAEFMFYDFDRLKAVDFSGLANANITDMSYMFLGCTGIKNIDLSELNTQNVTGMSNVFSGCSALQEIKFGKNFNTQNVTSMYGMFSECSSLTSLDLSSFDTSKVTKISLMFSGCHQLKQLDISSFDFSCLDDDLDMGIMFNAMDSMVKLTVPANMPYDLSFPYINDLALERKTHWEDSEGAVYKKASANIPKIMTYTRVGEGIEVLPPDDETTDDGKTDDGKTDDGKTDDGSTDDGKTDDGKTDDGKTDDGKTDDGKTDDDNTGAGYIFDAATGKLTITKNCDWDNLYQLYIENENGVTINPENVTSLEINMSGAKNAKYWNDRNVKTIVSKCVNVQDIAFTGTAKTGLKVVATFLFADMSKLKSIDFSGLEGAELTDTSYMFSGCTGITSLDLSNLNTQNVTTMQNMFSNCSSLQTINFGKDFSTKNVKDMNGMFRGCSNLVSLDVTGFDTSKVTDMSNMFDECSGLNHLDVTGFDTSKVEDMYSIFSGCSSLTSIDLSGFDTSNVMEMASMFSDCNQIKQLDISNFKFENVEDTITPTIMFGHMENAEKITVPANMPFALYFPYVENYAENMQISWQGPDGVAYEKILANMPMPMTYTRVISEDKDVIVTPPPVIVNPPVDPPVNPPVQPPVLAKPAVSNVDITAGRVSALATNIDAMNTNKIEWQIFDKKTNQCVKTYTSYATSTSISGVSGRKIYYIKCRAVGRDTNGNYVYSDWSDAKYFVTQPKMAMKSKHVGRNKVTVKWKKISGAKSYTIYAKKSTSKKWIKVKTTKSNSFVFRKLKGKKIDTLKDTYDFAVATNAKVGKQTIKSGHLEYTQAYSYYSYR